MCTVHYRKCIRISWLHKPAKILLVDITPHVEGADSGSVYFKHSSIDALSGYTPFHPDFDIVVRYWCHHKNCWSEYCIYQRWTLHSGESSAEMFLSPEAVIWIPCKVERVYRCWEYVSENYRVTSQMKRYKSSTSSNSKSWGQLLGEEGWERAEE